MRSVFVTTGILAAVAVAPAGANAFFVPDFSVVGKEIRSHSTADGGVASRDKLLDPANLSNTVGHQRVRCTSENRRGRVFCNGTISLNGEIGGAGKLHAGGWIGGGDRRLHVHGGTGDFNGVGGKLRVDDDFPGRRKQLLEFSLTR